jgi:malonyl-CoA O-methyltransferase
MSTKNEFSKHAKDYDNNNIIQRIVSKALVREINNAPKNILELGCGSGQIYREIKWPITNYDAMDFSNTMCELHPKHGNITINCLDFDSDEFYEHYKKNFYDLIISSSALQWSKDLAKLIQYFSSITKEASLVLFTSNTFKSIYEITQKKSTILSLAEIQDAFKGTNSTFEVLNYRLEFESKKKLFTYIKNSGVKGEVALSFKEARNLYKSYTLNYLEFEVIFIKTHYTI